MKIAFSLIVIVILSYSTGMLLEVVAEGDESKILRLFNTGQVDEQWIPFFIDKDLVKIGILKNNAMIEFNEIPSFIQLGELKRGGDDDDDDDDDDDKGPISAANVAFNIGVKKIDVAGKKSLQNVIDICIFHSPDEPFELCVICELLDDAGEIIGKGLVIEMGLYDPSESIEIPISSVPEPEFSTDPLKNDVQKVEGVNLVICETRGCTPGFWKTHSELGPASFNAWPTTGTPPFMTNQSYLTVFGISIEIIFEGEPEADPTLFEALNAQGGSVNALARHSVAALLNAASDLVV